MSIPLTIPDDWTPAQALAVYDKRVFALHGGQRMIDALQEAIWARYDLQLIELLKEERTTTFVVDDDVTF